MRYRRLNIWLIQLVIIAAVGVAYLSLGHEVHWPTFWYTVSVFVVCDAIADLMA